MYPKIEELENEYKQFQSLKKEDKELYHLFILMNQRLLIESGKFHYHCLNNWNKGGREEYTSFITNTFVGQYYNNWRKARAVSCAKCMDIYKLLEVNLKENSFIGETFYAGIPPVTEQEINSARINTKESENYQFISCSEKIGIDGVYRPVDIYGDFDNYPYDPLDIYGDNTNIKLEKQDEQN